MLKKNIVPFPAEPAWGEIGVGDRVYHPKLGSAIVLEIISLNPHSYNLRAKNQHCITVIAPFREFRLVRKARIPDRQIS